MSVRIGVVVFPGSLDDCDAARAVMIAGGEPVFLWHQSSDLSGVDAVIIPGGFSYGDYLRAGAIASRSPVIQALIPAASAGLPVLGICNGFQILCESGLLPGALTHNQGLHFRCIDQWLSVENTDTPFTHQFIPHEKILIPLKSGQGQYAAEPETLVALERENRIIFRYQGDNPNGSAQAIAGICSADRNIVGLMPHPEHAVEALTGPSLDGRKIFASLLASIVQYRPS